ncbi:hypothetical protein [Terrisporobacter muris]|uniref:Uncharacterized protein n=1 Tax=Terrisporobacter muris TaxID=2963284 RepID=A0A9X2S311_9FIRM|nr:hypothetical protein [Terrisporobacter muris]MCR1824414.1 hypothetical protein [Terrisporobacter muris]
MESRYYKDDLKDMILDMAHKELENYVSQKGAQKYFEGNIDKVINDYIKKISKDSNVNKTYLKVLKKGAYQENMVSVAKILRSQELFKSKGELIKFANYLGVKVNKKNSYSQILKKVSKHIYTNRCSYSKKYVFYKRNSQEYVLEPEKIKKDLIESYKSKTREDMKSIAKLLDIKIIEEDSAEDIRKKVINYIIKEKVVKKNH